MMDLLKELYFQEDFVTSDGYFVGDRIATALFYVRLKSQIYTKLQKKFQSEIELL